MAEVGRYGEQLIKVKTTEHLPPGTKLIIMHTPGCDFNQTGFALEVVKKLSKTAITVKDVSVYGKYKE